MSTRKGSNNRTRPQKHKNRTVFKNDLHDKTPQMKMLNSLHVCDVCQHCKAVIEWKIKYKKYKALTKPKTCIKCQERNVTKAYHVICRNCSRHLKVCCKCLKSAEEVQIEPPLPSDQEQQQLKSEMESMIKCLPERKRRTFLRYMARGKKTEKDDADDENLKVGKRTPHSRDELMEKFELLKLEEECDDDDSDLFEGSDFESNSEDSEEM